MWIPSSVVEVGLGEGGLAAKVLNCCALVRKHKNIERKCISFIQCPALNNNSPKPFFTSIFCHFLWFLLCSSHFLFTGGFDFNPNKMRPNQAKRYTKRIQIRIAINHFSKYSFFWLCKSNFSNTDWQYVLIFKHITHSHLCSLLHIRRCHSFYHILCS